MSLDLRSERREEVSPRRMILVLVGSLAAGFVVVGIILTISGANPFYALARIFAGSFGSVYGLKETVTKAIPLILIGSGLAVAFRARFWNIGAEGQLLLGAMFGGWVGLTLGPRVPACLVVPLMFLAGFAAGALWGLLPALFKVRLGVNEVISTLMLNYIAAEFLKALIVGPWKGKTQQGFPYTDDLPETVTFWLIPGSRIHAATLAIALAAAALLFLLIYYTKFGYEIRVIGENREAARYAGIGFLKCTLIMMAVSGGMAGLAGVGEVGGIHHHLTYPQAISSGYGYTAIIVAWLAKANPLATILSGFFFAGILVGGDAIQISLGLPAAAVNVFNGILLSFLIMGDYFLRHRVRISFKGVSLRA